MGQKTISQLPVATSVSNTDLLIVQQGGITKSTQASLLRSISATSVTEQVITASAGQTVFVSTNAYTPGTNNIFVYRNGLKLISGTDFTETNSNTVTLTQGADAGDQIVLDVGTTVAGNFQAANVAFKQDATGAVSTNVAAKLSEIVSVKDFGAVGDGITNDTAAVLAALQSGFVVDGGGLTYGISGTMQPSSFKGLRNANFVQLAPTTAGVATLYIYALSDWFIDNCKFDMGSVTNTGSNDDSSKSALRVRNADGSYCENFRISGVTVTGDGNGSRIQVRQSKRFTITECLVHDCVAGFTPDPTNDIMNGFDIGDCANFTISNCNVYNLRCILSGTPSNRYTRGFLFTEIRDCAITGCNSTINDQAFDFSGAVITGVTPAYYEGNRRFTISGCTANSAGTWGFKFANVTHDGLVTGCIANNSGNGGFICSPAGNIATTPARFCTSNIDFVGCKVVNVLASGGAGANAEAFRVAAGSGGTGFETYPRGIRFRSCEVIDNQTSPTTVSGFISDVAVVRFPTTDWDKNISNTAVSCSVGPGVTTPFSNIGPTVCVVTSTAAQSIPNGTWTDLGWDYNSIDNSGIHPTATNNANILIKEAGTYRIFARTQFAANDVGVRIMRVLQNGVLVDRTTVAVPASPASQVTTIGTEIIRYLIPGTTVRVEVYQTSGGALNAFTNEGLFMVNKLD
jgi:hypothetical protein